MASNDVLTNVPPFILIYVDSSLLKYCTFRESFFAAWPQILKRAEKTCLQAHVKVLKGFSYCIQRTTRLLTASFPRQWIGGCKSFLVLGDNPLSYIAMTILLLLCQYFP